MSKTNYAEFYKNTINNQPVSTSEKPTTKEPKYVNKKDPSIPVTIRLRKSAVVVLTEHFKLKGLLSLSTGLRQIIAKYMKDNNINN